MLKWRLVSLIVKPHSTGVHRIHSVQKLYGLVEKKMGRKEGRARSQQKERVEMYKETRVKTKEKGIGMEGRG